MLGYSTVAGKICKNMSNKSKIKYFNFAKSLSNHGITPPLTGFKYHNILIWAEQGTGSSHYKPEAYLKTDDSTVKIFKDVLPLLDIDSKILDIGCNCGRALNYLHNLGFSDFAGIEIGKKAVDLFREAFPDTYNDTDVMIGNAVKEIKKIPSNSFDLVYTNSVLVNIKDNSIFRDMCRISKKYILTYESEGSWTAYPRDFEKMFNKHGFEQISFNWYLRDENNCMCFPKKITRDNYLKRYMVRLFVRKDRV